MSQKTTNSKQTLKYYWKKAKKYPVLLTLNLLGIFIAILGGGLVEPLILKEIFDLIAQNNSNPDKVFDEIITWLIYLTIAFICLDFFGWRLAEFTNHYFQPKVMRDIEKDCFDKLQNHSFTFFSNNFSGGLVSKANRFSGSFEMIADVVQWNIWTTLIRFVFAISVIFYFAPLLGCIFMGWTILYIIASYYYAKWSGKFWKKNATKDSEVTAELADSISNMFNVKIFSAKEQEKERFWNTISDRQKVRTTAWHMGSLANVWQGLAIVIVQILMMYLMLSLWRSGQMTVGTIFAIQVFIMQIFENLWVLGQQFQNYANAIADADEMTDILQKIPDLLDPKNPEKLKISKGLIEFKRVDFQYSPEENSQKIFENFDLKINAGEKIGLVGESGAGKSTFISLLLRFSDLSSGKITIDKQDISHITQDDLRRSIAYVPQESILFHRTIAENISYGNPHATSQEIVEIAKKAHAHEFIMKTSKQYDTLVGERGMKLSGGQKQRIAIARAMLKKAPILVLDEATSALDSQSESEIQKAFDEIFLEENRTTIVIAHRLSTLQKMDRILVLADGKIIESGSHAQLIKNSGKYNELWTHQAGGFM